METIINEVRNRRLWLLAMAGAVMVTVLIAFGGFAAADSGKDKDNRFLSRVAEILEVEMEDLTDAFQDARVEYMEQVVQNRLEAMVEGGEISQAQADEYTAWYADRPAWAVATGFGVPGVRLYGEPIVTLVADRLAIERQDLSDAIAQAHKEILLENLERAVEDGRITQEQADEIAERIKNNEVRRS